jgi:hypothetical protein
MIRDPILQYSITPTLHLCARLPSKIFLSSLKITVLQQPAKRVKFLLTPFTRSAQAGRKIAPITLSSSRR